MGKYSPEYLTRREAEAMTFNFVRRAIRYKSILEARVIKCEEDNTLVINLGKNILGKIALEDLEYHTDEKETKPVSAFTKVGKHIKFIPLQIIDKVDGTYIIKCSRKEAQKMCFENYIKKLIPGDIIDARIIKVTGYGVFCDIGCGMVALLPTNNISVTHVVNPELALRFVHRLKVVVKEVDENFRIQLSHKELLGTWEEEASKFKEGDIVYGTVLSQEDYGTFIRLSQNLSGLAENPEFKIEDGDTVVVKISNIKPDKMKIKLILLEKLEPEDEETNLEKYEEHLRFKYTIGYGHIRKWYYSTPEAKRQIYTIFDDSEDASDGADIEISNY